MALTREDKLWLIKLAKIVMTHGNKPSKWVRLDKLVEYFTSVEDR